MTRKPESHPPYSYRNDPSVPHIPHDGPLTVMDGDCALCTIGARMIARLDKREEVRIATAQSALGAALLAHYGLDPEDPDTWLAIIDGKASTSLPAMTRLARHMGGWGHVLAPLAIPPALCRTGSTAA
jgi:predicted DCC family thiol-disulfide oxidoreductase YuxK